MTNDERILTILETVVDFQLRMNAQLNEVSKLLLKMAGEDVGPNPKPPSTALSFAEALGIKLDVAELRRMVELG